MVCVDINEDGAKEVADSLAQKGGKAFAVGLDISDSAAVESMVRRAVSEVGGVDILVNNAALHDAACRRRLDAVVPPEMWNQAFAVNVTGHGTAPRAAVPEMVKRGGGIVNQSSIGAFPAESVYGIAKVAMIGLTTTLARELGPSNINVNAIAPGLTQSVAGKALTGEDSPYYQMMKTRAALTNHVRG